jgi:hypothetical protein
MKQTPQPRPLNPSRSQKAAMLLMLFLHTEPELLSDPGQETPWFEADWHKLAGRPIEGPDAAMLDNSQKHLEAAGLVEIRHAAAKHEIRLTPAGLAAAELLLPIR